MVDPVLVAKAAVTLLSNEKTRKVAEIPGAQFTAFAAQPQGCYEFIEENYVAPNQDDGISHCLLVLGKGCADGALVQCKGFGAAALVAYVPDAREIVQANGASSAGGSAATTM